MKHALTVLCLLAGAGSIAAGEPTLFVSIKEHEVQCEISLPVPLADEFIDIEMEGRDFDLPEERERLGAALKALFAEKNPLEIDGVRVEPVLEDLVFVPAGGSVGFALVYATKGTPRTVSFVWELSPDAGPDELLVGLRAFGVYRDILLTAWEPEHTWHARDVPVARGPVPVVHEMPGRAFMLPFVPLGLLGGLVLALVTMRRRKTDPRIAAAATALVSVAALAFALSGRAEARLSRSPVPRKPTEEEAERIFETLHRNTYEAFDYVDESNVYDALALSVAGELLAKVYLEVYESRILVDNEEGYSFVQSVDILEKQVEPYASPLAVGSEPARPQTEGDLDRTMGFNVRCHWRVSGLIRHWGHTHIRENVYRAVYTVEPRGRAWKITGVKVLQHERIGADNDEVSMPSP